MNIFISNIESEESYINYEYDSESSSNSQCNIECSDLEECSNQLPDSILDTNGGLKLFNDNVCKRYLSFLICSIFH